MNPHLTIAALLLMFTLCSCEDPSVDGKPIVIVQASDLNPPAGSLFQATGTYQAVSFHPDSKQVVTSTGHGMDAWNIETGAHLWRIPDTGRVYSVRHLGDGERLITIEASHIQPSLVVHNLSEKRETLRFDACLNARTFSLSPDGWMVAMAAPEDPKPSKRTALEVLQGEKSISRSEEYRAKNTQNCAAAYNVKTGEELWKIDSVARPKFTKAGGSRSYRVEQLAFSPDQKTLVCMDSGGSWNPSVGPDRSQRFSFWNVSTGQMRHEWTLPDEYRTKGLDPDGIVWSKDGKFLMIQVYERQGKRYGTLCADPFTGEIIRKYEGIGVIVDWDRLVASDLERKEIVTYNLATGEELSSFEMREAPKRLNGVCASEDGRWLAGFDESKLYVFDLREQKQTAPLSAGLNR